MPSQTREAVRALLSACESESVCLSILACPEAQDLVRAARHDYRDVVAWASEPTRTYIVGLLRKGLDWSSEKDEKASTRDKMRADPA